MKEKLVNLLGRWRRKDGGEEGRPYVTVRVVMQDSATLRYDVVYEDENGQRQLATFSELERANWEELPTRKLAVWVAAQMWLQERGECVGRDLPVVTMERLLEATARRSGWCTTCGGFVPGDYLSTVQAGTCTVCGLPTVWGTTAAMDRRKILIAGIDT